MNLPHVSLICPETLDCIHTLNAFVLLDLEFTAWPGSLEHNWSRPGEVREIFQIGLCRVERSAQGSLVEVQAQSILVKTVIVPQLPEYSSNLTGITQVAIDAHGIPFSKALSIIEQYTDQGVLPTVSYGKDRDVLLENMNLLRCDFPSNISLTCYDIKPALRRFDSRAATLSSGELYTLLPNVSVEGRVHNALSDVRSVLAYLQSISR